MEKLHDYPVLIDPFLDLEATKQHFGTGSCCDSIGEKRLASGDIVVYLNRQREGKKVVDTTTGFGRVYEQGIVVCGYKTKPKGIFSFLRGSKIRLVPKEESRKVESELVDTLNVQGSSKIVFVDFWTEHRG